QLDRHCVEGSPSMKWDPVETLVAAVDALGFDTLGTSTQERAIRGRRFAALGTSTEGRAIRGRRFGGPGPALLVFGGIHGDEPASVEVLIELAPRVAATPRADAAICLLPAVSPDGVAAGRKNSARDVDLNRNFPARSFATAHAPGYFPGPAPLSEPETRVIADLIAREPTG